MKNLKFAIIGNPIAHSLSPLMHNYWFKKYNIDAEYQALKIRESQIKDVVDQIKQNKIQGINVTLPYKKSVIPFLTKTVNDAKETHSVNTIFMDRNNNLIGENTDVFGFQAGYIKAFTAQNKKNKKALVLGAGGVSSSIVLALLKSDIKDISLTNRTYEKSLFIKRKFPKINIIRWEDYTNVIQKFDILINATSLGLKDGNDFKPDFLDLKKDLIYIDTIYNPSQTKMIKFFKSKKVKTFNGLNMFIYQGQKSFYLWNKINPEVDDNLVKLLETKIN